MSQIIVPTNAPGFSVSRELQKLGNRTSRFATIAKLTAGRLVRKVADACLQFHGGIGYMEETWVSRYFRDSRLLSIGGGVDEVMLRTLARMDDLVGAPA